MSGDPNDSVETALLDFMADTVEPVPPPADLRARLLATVADTNRFDDLVDQVAEMYDVSSDRALELLARVDVAERWKPGMLPGTRMITFRPGEKYGDHLVGFVRVPPGSAFPWHEHVGDELTFVLQGRCCDTDGTVLCRGDYGRYESGTAHDFTTPEDGPDFVFAVRLGPGWIRVVDRPGTA
jgi:hypothetical protein